MVFADPAHDFLGVPRGSGPRRGGRRRRAARGASCGPGRRGVHRPSSRGAGTGRAGRLCGRDDPSCRSAPGGGTRRACGSRASRHGRHPRPGSRREASCRTRPDAGTTDRASRIRCSPATLRSGRRASGTVPCSSGRPRRRGAFRHEVNDRGRPVLTVELTKPHEQRLIQPERGRLAEPVRIVVDERFAIGDHGVVDGVPRALERSGELVHRAAVLTDLTGHPPRLGRSSRRAPTRSAWLHRSMTPPHRRVRAFPTMLAPHEPDRSTERGEVDQLNLGPVLDERHSRAFCARRPWTGRLDHDPQRLAGSSISRTRSRRADLPTARRRA